MGLVGVVPGCAGGTFVVEPALSRQPGQTVTGPTFTAPCETDPKRRAEAKTAIEQLAAAAPVATHLGDATLTVGPLELGEQVHREQREQVLGKIVEQLSRASVPPTRAAQIHAAANDGALDGLISVKTSLQTATVPFALERLGRVTLGVCVSALTANFGHPLERALVTLSCTLAAEGAPAWRLQAFATGSWANYRYRGAVIGGGVRWSFASQNVSVLGAGAVRGFELRDGGAQIGALSFWENGPLDASFHSTIVARSWALPQRAAEADDVLVASLALARALPWPTSCDSGILEARRGASGPE